MIRQPNQPVIHKRKEEIERRERERIEANKFKKQEPVYEKVVYEVLPDIPEEVEMLVRFESGDLAKPVEVVEVVKPVKKHKKKKIVYVSDDEDED